jgi:hypothetical protein
LYGLLGLGTTVVVIANIVHPKVVRVRSGEKVVVSRLLATGTGTGPSTSELRNSTIGTENSRVSYSIGEKIKINKDDPMPREIEKGVMELQQFLRLVVDATW